MALVLSPFSLNVDKIGNNGIANSPMWQMGNWGRETLSISHKALLQLGSCPFSIILSGVEAQRKLLIWSQRTVWAGRYLDDSFPAKPAVWSSSASSITVCLPWHKVWSPNVQDWERRWGQLRASLVKRSTFICKRCLRGLSPKLSFMQQFLHFSGSILGEKAIRHYILEEHWSHDKAVLGTPPER